MAWWQPGNKPLSEPMTFSYWHIYASLSLNELKPHQKISKLLKPCDLHACWYPSREITENPFTFLHNFKTVQLIKNSVSELIPAEMRDEVRQLYSAVGELLRHYWACYPTTSPALEEKLLRMRTSLDRFHQTKLSPLKDRLANYHYSINVSLFSDL